MIVIHNTALTRNLILVKALTLHSLRLRKSPRFEEGKSEASRAWLMGFQERCYLHGIRRKDKALCECMGTSAGNLGIGKVIDEDGYINKQIYNTD